MPTAVAAADSGSGAAGVAGASVAVAQTSSARVVLELGSRGALVAALQQRLNAILPFSHLAVDGIFGPLTQGAVVHFQRGHGLLADGKVDVGMWARMFDAPVLVFGASGSSGPAASAPGRAHAEFASLNRTRSAAHRAGDGGGAAVFRSSRPAPATRPNHVTTSAGTSGGSLIAGGPGASSGVPNATSGVSQPVPVASQPAPTASQPAPTVGGDSGGAPFAVVAPTTPTTQSSTYVLSNGVALPLPRQYLTGGYVDQGVDYSAPGGTPEYAMGSGVIIGEGISGFGPNAPILKITSGPLAGLEVYYGHSGPDVVKVGDHVTAGQQITAVGNGIVGISTGPHLEVGFYPVGAMGAGSRMLSVINALLKQHPTGRVWISTTSSTGHIARDRRSRATRRPTATTSRGSVGASSSGGAAVGSDVSSQPTAAPASTAPQPASAPAPVQSSSPAQPQATPAPQPAASTPAQPATTVTQPTSTTQQAAPATPEPAATPTAPVPAPAPAPTTTPAATLTPAPATATTAPATTTAAVAPATSTTVTATARPPATSTTTPVAPAPTTSTATAPAAQAAVPAVSEAPASQAQPAPSETPIQTTPAPGPTAISR